MVVRLGVVMAEEKMLSKPQTETSLGTRIPRAVSSARMPRASHVVNADERGGIAATADELGGQGAADVVLVGHVGESVGLGAAFGGKHLKTIPNSMEFQLPADALQALAARQGELIEGCGDKDQPAVAQLAQMLGQERACGHVAQLNGAYAQLVLLFPDEHRGQGVGDFSTSRGKLGRNV